MKDPLKDKLTVARKIMKYAGNGMFEEIVDIVPQLLYASNDHRLVIITARDKDWMSTSSPVVYCANYVLHLDKRGFVVLKDNGQEDLVTLISELLNTDLTEVVSDKDKLFGYCQRLLVPSNQEDVMYLKLGGSLL